MGSFPGFVLPVSESRPQSCLTHIARDVRQCRQWVSAYGLEQLWLSYSPFHRFHQSRYASRNDRESPLYRVLAPWSVKSRPYKLPPLQSTYSGRPAQDEQKDGHPLLRAQPPVRLQADKESLVYCGTDAATALVQAQSPM